MRTSHPKPMETMERISRQYLCDHFDEILERVDKEDIGFVILNEEGKDGEVLIPYRWTEFFVDDDLGIVINSALRYAIICVLQLDRVNDYETQIRKPKAQLAKEQKGENKN